MTALTDQLTTDAGGASAVLDKTATALEDAGTTAASFATTLDSGSSALLGATDDMRQIVPRLRDLESAANAVTIIGAQPLGRLRDPVRRDRDQPDGRHQPARPGLEEPRRKPLLARGQRALAPGARGPRSGRSPTSSPGDQLGAAIDSIRWLILALLIVETIGAGVPAVGALVTGWWLRGWLARTPAGGAAGTPPLVP